jgi:hypothetical protein
MSDEIYQTVGRIEGKVDSLTQSIREYTLSHEGRHHTIDTHMEAIKADINQAKGAKGAIIIAAGAVATIIGGLMHGIEKLFK